MRADLRRWFAAVGSVVFVAALWTWCTADPSVVVEPVRPPLERREVRPVARGATSAVRVPDRPLPDVAQNAAAELAVETPVTPPPEDYSYNNADPRMRERGPHDPLELSVLADIIALNGLQESSSRSDFDDGDGVFEPLEFGTQVWCGGHLRELYTGPSEYTSFGYRLRQLPSTIGDLRRLTRLNLNSNALEELPASVAELGELRVLELYDNRLRELPESLGRMRALELLQVRGNQLQEIPASVVELPQLTALFASDNPLTRLPQRMLAQSAPGPRVVRRDVDCSPRS